MRLRGITRSRNIEDRRGRGRGRAAGGLGIGGILLLLVIGWVTGIDVMPLISGGQAPATVSRPVTEADQREGEFAARVLATTEQVWSREFPEQVGRPYDPPVMVLFSGVTQSPCGGASGATGPFYCPADEKAYLDTSFFTTMRDRLGAGGDFAAAYVIAHEVAHHIQNELGILDQLQQARRSASQAESNALTVRSELMADCLSGIWARNVGDLMERGDLQEALNAARMIGDDHLQRQAGRTPQPHTFTHGTSEQRARWFQRGYDSGMMSQCDTFAAQQL
ncbi:neutral zinc metallopeptidase [uncultured Tateyamaria sp.]|uniref:KPN_02809 family neutral zinc metallopeptidase n=1 Tax=uncultured Tateyamaria sp. TaxID=455651 RepID=UPI00262331C7|nr:neutral zinc metallopeptidase [uncultured Tateyamaria sp.]